MALTTADLGFTGVRTVEGHPLRASAQDWLDSLRTTPRGHGDSLVTRFGSCGPPPGASLDSIPGERGGRSSLVGQA
jgi:hypothetical protein